MGCSSSIEKSVVVQPEKQPRSAIHHNDDLLSNSVTGVADTIPRADHSQGNPSSAAASVTRIDGNETKLSEDSTNDCTSGTATLRDRQPQEEYKATRRLSVGTQTTESDNGKRSSIGDTTFHRKKSSLSEAVNLVTHVDHNKKTSVSGNDAVKQHEHRTKSSVSEASNVEHDKKSSLSDAVIVDRREKSSVSDSATFIKSENRGQRNVATNATQTEHRTSFNKMLTRSSVSTVHSRTIQSMVSE